MAFFQLTAKAPWGDYGRILIHGMCGRNAPVEKLAILQRQQLPAVNVPVIVERTGPYVPSIFAPGIDECLIVNTGSRETLDRNHAGSFRFRPVTLGHVVWSDWHTWNLNAARAPILPPAGEPEDYILGQPYSEDAAKAIGDLWELILPLDGLYECEKREDATWDLWFCDPSWKSSPLFYAQRKSWRANYHIFATETGWELLQCIEVDKWLKAEPVEVRPC